MLVEVNSSEALVSVPATPKEMLSVSTEGGKTRVKINSSSLSIIQACPRKAQYALHEGWKTSDEGAPTLFGKAIHAALETYYLGNPEERILPKLEELEPLAYGHGVPDNLIVRAVAAFVKEAQPLASLPDSDKRSILNGVWILHEYFKTYINDPYVAYVDAQGPFIERDFVYRLAETDGLIIDIFGRIDFGFQHTQTKALVIGDHKTASFLNFGGQSYFDREKPNHQYTLYALGAKRVFGLDVEDFMVNVVEVKARPKGPKAKGVSFPRQITKRTEEDFEELKEVITSYVLSYLAYRKKEIWPMGGVDACNLYSGCQFKQVCASPRSLRETLLQNKFIKGVSSEAK
jgi:hypothetical protein